jgi:hypothetical protein
VIRLRAPEKEGSIDFEIRFNRSSVAYRYEVLELENADVEMLRQGSAAGLAPAN